MNRISRAASFWVFTLICGPFLLAQPRILCTNSILADIAVNIGGAEVEVNSIVPLGSDPHIYEAVPQDIINIRSADLIILNGLGLENWLNKIILNSGYYGPTVIASEGIKDIISAVEFNSHDPHAWMSPINGIQFAKNISAALSQLIPDKKHIFERNLNLYENQLLSLDQEISRKFQSLTEDQRILITSHDAFRYFGNRYRLTVEPLMGISTEADLQVSDIRRISDLLSSRDIRAIFVETTINPKLMNQISQDFGVNLSAPLYADSLGDPDTEAGTYLGMLSYDASVIAAALTGEDTRTQYHIDSAHTKTASLTSFVILILSLGTLFAGMVILLNRHSG